jgi:hypothetical protein
MAAPQENEARAGGAAAGLGEQDQSPAIVPDIDAERKTFETLRAKYALRGFELIELADGSLLAHKWDLTRPLPDAHAARQFLKLIGGAA